MIKIHYQSISLASKPSSSASASASAASSDQILFRNPRIISVSTKPQNPTVSLSSRNQRRQSSLLQRLCKASLGRRKGDRVDGDENDRDRFYQASVLVSETVRHYNLWKQGFVENTKWNSPGQGDLFYHQRKGDKPDANIIGNGILQRFQSPTIFLKISCDGDLLLPIIVGEFAIVQLINYWSDGQNEENPDQFQFAKNVAEKFGYEVKMVQITERVVSTYHARIYLGKPSHGAHISIDARPSDAINLAERFKAPIYVSREIVLKDAMKIMYGKWRGNGKIAYDVTLDSAVEGDDPLAEEIDMMQKMKTAILEERYKDAAMWRDKLTKFRLQS